MAKSGYTPVSSFWAVIVPAVLGGVLYYGYTTPSWVGVRIQKLFGPVVEPILHFFHRIV